VGRDASGRPRSTEASPPQAVSAPRRGELWLADLNPTRGREQAGRRPVLVLSVDAYNGGPSDLVIVLAVTTTLRTLPTQVPISRAESDLDRPSAVLCDQLRSIARERLLHRIGALQGPKLQMVEDAVRILLGL
jgi:mRNA interferase MazF